MALMTEEEAEALDEELTRTTPKVDFSKPDIYIHQRAFMNSLNPAAADYIMTRRPRERAYNPSLKEPAP